MDTAKIVISWNCNLKCSYCCNEMDSVRNTFKPITMKEIANSNYKDYELTGGEVFMYPAFEYLLNVLWDGIPKGRNVYVYTNGILLDIPRVKMLKKYGVTGINIGYHQIDLNWTLIKYLNENVLPIRLWVKEDEYEDWMDDLGMDIRLWKLGDCDNVTTDRFYLEV